VVKVRPISIAKKKFEEAVKRAAPFYELGVKNPRENLVAAVEARKQAMYESLRDAIEKDLIFGGLKRRGHEFWQKRAVEKGARRWGDETPKRVDDWESGFKPFADTLSAVAMSPKRRKGDPANIAERVGAIVQALIRKKHELRGAAPSV
jgi:hypothetical protein